MAQKQDRMILNPKLKTQSNEIADQVAKAANRQLNPPMVQEWTNEAKEMVWNCLGRGNTISDVGRTAHFADEAER